MIDLNNDRRTGIKYVRWMAFLRSTFTRPFSRAAAAAPTTTTTDEELCPLSLRINVNGRICYRSLLPSYKVLLNGVTASRFQTLLPAGMIVSLRPDFLTTTVKEEEQE